MVALFMITVERDVNYLQFIHWMCEVGNISSAICWLFSKLQVQTNLTAIFSSRSRSVEQLAKLQRTFFGRLSYHEKSLGLNIQTCNGLKRIHGRTYQFQTPAGTPV